MRLNLLASRKLWTTWMPHGAIAVFFVLCYLGFRKDLSKISFESLPRSYDVYLLVVGMVFISYIVRAMRWRQYLLTLGYELPKLYGVLTYVAGFAYTLAPGKVGELMKATYYRPYKIPMTVVTAAFFVERLSDLAVFVCLALVFLGFVAQGYGSLLIMAGLCVPVAVLLTALLRERHLKTIEQCAWVRFARLGPVVAKLAEGIEAAKKLLTFKVLIWGLFLGFAGWLCECLSLYVLGALVPHTPLLIGDAIGMYAAAIVVGAVSFLPGGLGTTEAAMVALLVNYGYSVQDAVVLTIVCRLLTLWVAVLLGWIAVGVLKLVRAGELQ
jgi:uncharacterized protein (TIRG00374 family)